MATRWLTPVLMTMRVDEHLHFLEGRSNSACAKKALALRRISLAIIARTMCGWLLRGKGFVRWMGLVGRGHVCGV